MTPQGRIRLLRLLLQQEYDDIDLSYVERLLTCPDPLCLYLDSDQKKSSQPKSLPMAPIQIGQEGEKEGEKESGGESGEKEGENESEEEAGDALVQSVTELEFPANGKLVLFLYSEWCEISKRVYAEFKKAAYYLKSQIRFVKMDIGQNKSLAEQFSYSGGPPYYLYILRDGPFGHVEFGSDYWRRDALLYHDEIISNVVSHCQLTHVDYKPNNAVAFSSKWCDNCKQTYVSKTMYEDEVTSPFALACLHGSLAIVRLLHNHHTTHFPKEQSMMHQMVREGLTIAVSFKHVTLFKQLLGWAFPFIAKFRTERLLELAFTYNSVECVQALFDVVPFIFTTGFFTLPTLFGPCTSSNFVPIQGFHNQVPVSVSLALWAASHKLIDIQEYARIAVNTFSVSAFRELLPHIQLTSLKIVRHDKDTW